MFHDVARAAPWAAGYGYGAYSSHACHSHSIHLPDFPDLKVLSLDATLVKDYTFILDPFILDPEAQVPVSVPDFCNVTVAYTHPGWHDVVTINAYLPDKEEWNGRYMANGGGGLVTGGVATEGSSMLPGLAHGYAVATTDGGHESSLSGYAPTDVPWALSSPGNVNWPLLVDFSSVALHDMAVVGKALVRAYYGERAARSYFYGGSTGGRQGHMLAQRYPEDFDGVVATMPAMNWARFLWTNLWPTFVMDQLGFYPRPCELNAITEAAIAACDPLDGVRDGIVSRMDLCKFDPHDLVGEKFDCSGTPSKFSEGAAVVAKAAWEGPRSSTGEWQWYGFSPSANISQLGIGAATTQCDTNGGNCRPIRFQISESWARYWVKKNPDFSMEGISHEVWDELIRASVNEYTSIIGTEDPDLTGLRKSGNKLLSWHGVDDQAIPVNGTADYYDRVLARDPQASEYYRFFVSPGSLHCTACGMLPHVMDVMEVMVDWVEKGIAPDTLPAKGTNRNGVELTRNICMYPRVQHYVGGDIEDPSSFKCV